MNLSPSITSRQTLQGMSSEVSAIRKKLFELALYDTPLLSNNNYFDAMKHLHEASLELSYLRVVASPDPVGTIAHGLPDPVDAIINRI